MLAGHAYAQYNFADTHKKMKFFFALAFCVFNLSIDIDTI